MAQYRRHDNHLKKRFNNLSLDFMANMDHVHNHWFREQWLRNKRKEVLMETLEEDRKSPFMNHAEVLKVEEFKRWFNERAFAYGPDINNWPDEERPLPLKSRMTLS